MRGRSWCLPPLLLLLLVASSVPALALLRRPPRPLPLPRLLVGYCSSGSSSGAATSARSGKATAGRNYRHHGRHAHCRRLTTIMSASALNDAGGLLGFLRQARAALLQAHQDTTNTKQLKVVIGNEAADADSMVSAMCLAYFLQNTAGANTQYVPVLSLPRAEMKLRPETLLLLRLTGAAEVAGAEPHLTFVDEADLTSLVQRHKGLKVVLVDHNKLCAALQPLDEKVEAIVDHHEDKGHYPWVQDAKREVAFEGGMGNGNGSGGSLSAASSMASLGGGPGFGLDGSTSSLSLSRSSSAVGKALVASTCTLVAERFLAHAPHLLQPSAADGDVAALLLGVIMLDAAGLEPKAGKVTGRDVAAVAALEKLACPAAVGDGGKMGLYKRLSGAKFDTEWWRSLSVRDALRLDYKAFSATTAKAGPLRFGMSSVLVPVQDILSKEPLLDAVLRAFATERKVELLVLMSLVMDPASGAMQRALAIYAPEKAVGAALVERLLNPETEGPALELSEAAPGKEDGDGRGLWVFRQGNAQASRKQVEPILRKLLEDPALAYG